jgi:hypothetical protein
MLITGYLGDSDEKKKRISYDFFLVCNGGMSSSRWDDENNPLGKIPYLDFALCWWCCRGTRSGFWCFRGTRSGFWTVRGARCWWFGTLRGFWFWTLRWSRGFGWLRSRMVGWARCWNRWRTGNCWRVSFQHTVLIHGRDFDGVENAQQEQGKDCFDDWWHCSSRVNSLWTSVFDRSAVAFKFWQLLLKRFESRNESKIIEFFLHSEIFNLESRDSSMFLVPCGQGLMSRFLSRKF